MRLVKENVPDQIGRWLMNSRPTLVLAVSKDALGANITTIAWYSPVVDLPFTLGFSLHNRSYSKELLVSHGKGSFNILGVAFIDSITGPGFTTGRDRDKAALFNIPVERVDDIPIVSSAFASILFDVVDSVNLGRSTWFTVSPTRTMAHEEAHRDGILTLSKPEWQPVHHLGEHEYVVMNNVHDWQKHTSYPSPNKRP